MTCTEVRDLLPTHIYGDLSADEAVAVGAHLRECPACRAEAAALRGTRAALDEMPTPPVRVNLPGLYATLAEQRVRRWRRLAVAGAALAACLLVAFALRLTVSIDDGRLVIALSGAHDPVSRDAERIAPTDALRSASRLTELNERLQLQEQLTRALIDELDSRDRRLAADLDAVRQQVAAVGQFAARQWAEAERTMNALYVAQFKRPEEKANP